MQLKSLLALIWLACVAGGIVFACVVLAAKLPFSWLCREKRQTSAKGVRKFQASPPHSPHGFFSSTKPRLCTRERSRRLCRLLFGCQCFIRVSFRGEIKPEPRPDWSPLGVKFNFPMNIPVPFIWESPPSPPPGC